MKYFAVYPGPWISYHHDETHWISAVTLRRLYGVHDRECVTIERNGWRGYEERHLNALMPLWPSDHYYPISETTREYLRHNEWWGGDHFNLAEVCYREAQRDNPYPSLEDLYGPTYARLVEEGEAYQNFLTKTMFWGRVPTLLEWKETPRLVTSF